MSNNRIFLKCTLYTVYTLAYIGLPYIEKEEPLQTLTSNHKLKNKKKGRGATVTRSSFLFVRFSFLASARAPVFPNRLDLYTL